jgi:cellulose synthase/poly-beta-1,6-N-acetylglucosamine synthase-like glycosyltransferase
MYTLCILVFWTSLVTLVYVYVGYPGLLMLGRTLGRSSLRKAATHASFNGSLSVIVAALNEAAVIRDRIADILSQDAPVHEVIIGSDGSDDETAAAARSYPDPRVRVLEFPVRRGRTPVCNDCIDAATGQIVVFTDAETRFRPGFLREIMRPFRDPSVAVTVGKILWRSAGHERAGAYWSMELALRDLESDLGLLATASGPGMAVRRSCYEALLADEDPDFSTPIQVVRKGFRVVYVPEAVATDAVPPSARAEFRARSRMVTKNFVGTIRELTRTSLRSHPGLWWSLLSHKLFRWMTPVFLIAMLVAALGPGMEQVRPLVLTCYGVGGLAVLAGALSELRGFQLPIVTHAWNLAVVNTGMLVGLLRAAYGRRITSWEPTGHRAD